MWVPVVLILIQMNLRIVSARRNCRQTQWMRVIEPSCQIPAEFPADQLRSQHSGWICDLSLQQFYRYQKRPIQKKSWRPARKIKNPSSYIIRDREVRYLHCFRIIVAFIITGGTLDATVSILSAMSSGVSSTKIRTTFYEYSKNIGILHSSR